jgi:GxxExxY protein
LKPGLDEKLYERALVIELRARGHQVDQQNEFPVSYEGQHIGTLIPDLIVDGLVIADPKVVSAFTDTHTAQMLGYLNITGLKTGAPSQLQTCSPRLETHRPLIPICAIREIRG